tara:strand:- start:71 stop:337 length:267 start_codon:yes stop_codon:yes gene_type:complete
MGKSYYKNAKASAGSRGPQTYWKSDGIDPQYDRIPYDFWKEASEHEKYWKINWTNEKILLKKLGIKSIKEMHKISKKVRKMNRENGKT